MRPATEAVADGCYNACPLMAAAPSDHATTHDVAFRIGAPDRHAAPSRSRIGAA